MGPKTEKYLFPKVSREKRGTVSRELSGECNVLEGQCSMCGMVQFRSLSVKHRFIN